MNLRLSQSEAVFLGFAASKLEKVDTVEAVDAALDESGGGEVFVEVPDEDLEDGLTTWVAHHSPKSRPESPVSTLLGKIAG